MSPEDVLGFVNLKKDCLELCTGGLTPVILVTQEVEIRRLEFRSQPGQVVLKALSRKTLHKNRAGGSGSRCTGPEFKLQNQKK
jgi:hypothetical protein